LLLVEHHIYLNQEQLVKVWEELGTHLGRPAARDVAEFATV